MAAVDVHAGYTSRFCCRASLKEARERVRSSSTSLTHSPPICTPVAHTISPVKVTKISTFRTVALYFPLYSVFRAAGRIDWLIDNDWKSVNNTRHVRLEVWCVICSVQSLGPGYLVHVCCKLCHHTVEHMRVGLLFVHQAELLGVHDPTEVPYTRVVVDENVAQIKVVEGSQGAPIWQNCLVFVPHKPKDLPMEASIFFAAITCLKPAEYCHK